MTLERVQSVELLRFRTPHTEPHRLSNLGELLPRVQNAALDRSYPAENQNVHFSVSFRMKSSSSKSDRNWRSYGTFSEHFENSGLTRNHP